ncbi:Peroxisomal membrane protein PAS20 [Choanephora cucurbitarum]|uniref:Peroxisomal membrane protein PEX13 n=1 Tax=Choanephora cucurbitarum TaxID=101091 RepID=A0A1C7NQM7_9FUNG|nr:Peroxisomal membrane protein PAS20 [Choanephora cucurbitarum]
MPSPPKPWEVNNTASATPVVSQATDNIPAVPDRPTATNAPNTLSSSYGGTLGGFGNTTNSYGGIGGYGSSYNSPYNRLGYGSSYGGYGSSYGGYGSSYGGYGGYGSYGGMNSYGYNRFGGGYNRFGNGMYGPEGPDEFTLSRRMESSTRATFDVIESIVSAFGGFAQMLDSTYMATHSSFMAMVGVAEQYGNLRHYLGNIFNVFALIRWIKRVLYRLVGKTPPPELNDPVPDQNDEHLQITENDSNQGTAPPLPPPTVTRKRSILLFLALVTGLPYFIYKLIQRSNRFRQQQMQTRMMIPQYGGPPPETARVMHDFVAEAPIELSLKQGEKVEVLSKVDPATGAPCEWWQGRSANGVIGIFPANFVQIEN